jgi:hypothetical protein
MKKRSWFRVNIENPMIASSDTKNTATALVKSPKPL